jgi:death on curing protein
VTTPKFLNLGEVIDIHQNQIELYGGLGGVRNLGLLESALAMPEASFGGEFLHVGLYEMAAAYLFHLAKNHPFLDGNKRTALMAALAFLERNGVEVDAPEEPLVQLVLNVAEGKATKAEAAVFLSKHARP